MLEAHSQNRCVVAVLGAVVGLAFSQMAFADVPSDVVKRGEYLSRAADCMPCHTAPGGKPFAGGLGFKLPFGTLYSPNITADASTGIGRWSDDDFIRAMHEGIGRGGQRLYPAFPYPYYTLLSRDDVRAIKAYLFSLPTVQNSPPENNLKFPFNMRWLMVFWDWLYNPDRRFEADESKPAQWNRGAYLVEALGHCGDCHTPRNFLYGPQSGKKFAGAVTMGWRAYNITPDQKTGIGRWSDRDLTKYLETGDGGHGVAAGPMGEIVDASLRYLSRDDIEAMVAYLRSVPAVLSAVPAAARLSSGNSSAPNTSQLPAADELARLHSDPGMRMFAAACTGCHGWNGLGVAGTREVNDPEATNLTQVILGGIHLSASGGQVNMPGFGKAYSDAELAAIVNYVTGRFGGSATMLKPEDVAKRRNGD